jgi:hypothetical protein
MDFIGLHLIKGTVIAGMQVVDSSPIYRSYISNIYIGCNGVIYFVARYLSKTRTVPITLSPPFGSSGCLYLRYYLFFPNFSTTALIFQWF